ncbi:MAG TPA: ADP-ribosylglycohydrolase family protein [Armatimonadota bacterium]|nr:ADP-ribosylglycohydrolase family protein [Armatimonadota bacterium]
MLGAIAGDVIGSVYEAHPIKTTDFPLLSPRCRFTDDTVLTVAVARAILEDGDYVYAFRQYCRRWPDAGFGGKFFRWATGDNPEPYNSFGNGSAMRVSPVAYAFDAMDAVLGEAKRSAEVTHNHPEGVRGAQAVAGAVFLARMGRTKDEIHAFVTERFAYDLGTPLTEIRPTYRFNVTCQGSVPQAMRAFLESVDFESAIRLAVSLGGDADTQASIAGAIAEPFYGGVPKPIADAVLAIVDDRMHPTIQRFRERYIDGRGGQE